MFPRYLVRQRRRGRAVARSRTTCSSSAIRTSSSRVAISAFAIQAHHAFIYLRGEFALGAERLGRRSTTPYAHGFLGKNILGSGFDLELVVHRGAGCYIAGDETGLLSSLEGERAMPRIKPPFPAVAGPLRRADGREQRRDDLDASRTSSARAASGTRGSA